MHRSCRLRRGWRDFASKPRAPARAPALAPPEFGLGLGQGLGQGTTRMSFEAKPQRKVDPHRLGKAILVALVAFVAASKPPSGGEASPPRACIGDCDRDGRVSVNE